MNSEENLTSEFGRGFTYCLGLFLMHTERHCESNWEYWAWFNGANDHLQELEVPENLPDKLKISVKEFTDFCFQKASLESYKTCNDEDRKKAITWVKEILFEYDKFIGINPVTGRYE